MFIGKRISALLVLCCGIQSCHVFFFFAQALLCGNANTSP